MAAREQGAKGNIWTHEGEWREMHDEKLWEENIKTYLKERTVGGCILVSFGSEKEPDVSICEYEMNSWLPQNAGIWLAEKPSTSEMHSTALLIKKGRKEKLNRERLN